MKLRLCCVVVLFLMICNSYAKTTFLIDERIELTCVVFRLAGCEEYCSDIAQDYTNDIESYFKDYENHPLIKYVKDIRVKQGIAYDSAILTASLFQIEKNRILFKPGVDINKYVSEGSLWTFDSLSKYTTLLDDFYRKSKFRTFYMAHAAMYEKTKEIASLVVPEIQPEWFQNFLGMELKDVSLSLGPSLGPHNYGMIYDAEAKQIDIIIGCNSCVDGIPMIDVLTVPVIIHEVMHYYSSALVYKYVDDLHVDELYQAVETDLYNKAHYGGVLTMAGEWVNELFANMYMIDNQEKEAPLYRVASNEDKGFIWSSRGIMFMKNFYANRDIYPTINEFMPQLIGFLNSLVPEINILKQEFELRKPYLVNVYPSPGTIVDKNLKEIRFTFSQPMFTKAQGVSILEGFETVKPEQCEWSDDGKTFIFHLDPLLPNTDYGIKLSPRAFIGMSGHRMKEEYSITFKTAD